MNFNRYLWFTWTAVAIFMNTSCSVGFNNTRNKVPELYTNVYIPSAVDHSIAGGQASRLSVAIRQALTVRSDLHLVPLDQASWALKISIENRLQSIAAVDDCSNPGTATVASGAYNCSTIHPELTGGDTSLPTSYAQPSVSPSSESIALIVNVQAIDLNTGQVLWAKRYDPSTMSAVAFNEIGDTGDGRTMTYTATTPDLHTLRYEEAEDQAVATYSQNIASDIATVLFRDWGIATKGMVPVSPTAPH